MRDFAPAMGFLCEMLPMQRALGDEALAMAWETMPNGAKIHLTRESLAFAVKQRLIDPAPPKDVALHIQLLRYVFPIERTVRRDRGKEVFSDRVLIENGPRGDLRQRMADPDRFHDPAPARQEQRAAAASAPRLPGGSKPWHPDQLTPEQRRAHVLRVAESARRVIAQGPDERTWTSAQLQQGAWWFGRALQGFWLLEVDDGGIAKAWLARNPAWAERLIEEALAGTAPQLPPAEGLAVAFSSIGTGGREVA